MKIEVGRLNKVYRGDINALTDVDLSITSGMFGLLGPNGAGKTTLMRILAGILRPTSGDLYIGDYDGNSEKGRTSIKKILGYLPQELGVYPDLSAREFLDYIAILKGMDDRKVRVNRVSELLELVSLTRVANRKLKTFSGGMKRRVGIAQALLNDPKLLIVDEPTAGLDPEERIHFRNLLSELAGNRTVLLSTHIVEDIAQTSQNLAVVKSGHVIFRGTAVQLISETRGHVWTMTTPGDRPAGNVAIVSTLNAGAAVHYHVVSAYSPHPDARAVEPTLEDSYVWLMHAQRTPVSTTSL